MTGWAALDRRTVVVAALLMAGVSISAGVPTGIGIAQATSIGTALLWLLPAAALLVAGGSAVEYVRWRRTRYRLAPGRVELRTGVLVSRHRSLQRDRIRTVDITADPLLRAFGLVTVRIGTGEQSGAGEASVVLRPVRAAVGESLRRELLARADGRVAADGALATLDPRWIRYAPVSFLAPLLGVSAFGGVLQVAKWFGLQSEVIDRVLGLFRGVPLAVTLAVLVAVALAVGAVAALGLWVEMWWNYRLDREPGTLRVRRGLFTTRSTSIEESRLRGVELVEPLAARGGVATVAAVLALGGVLVAEVLLHAAWVSAVVLVPIAAALAVDAHRGLGHGLGERYLVARRGSVRRATVALQRAGIIGWTVRQSIFQRRAGLATLVATTAAGAGAYAVPDASCDDALALAAAAVPGLLDPFLEPPPAPVPTNGAFVAT